MFTWTEKFASTENDEFYDILNINYNGNWSPITRVTFRDIIYEMNKGTGSVLVFAFLSGLITIVVVKGRKLFST